MRQETIQRKVEQYIGKRFGFREVLALAGRKASHYLLLCRCKCGRLDVVLESVLKRKNSRGCHNCAVVTHGQTKNHEIAREYRTWVSIIARCNYPSASGYALYGGRGIQVADEWTGRGGFPKFLACVGLKPSPKHELDRIDNNGNYEPGNVRWVTRQVNSRNKRTCRYLTINGETKTVKDWSEISSTGYRTILARLNRGLSAQKAVFGN